MQTLRGQGGPEHYIIPDSCKILLPVFRNPNEVNFQVRFCMGFKLIKSHGGNLNFFCLRRRVSTILERDNELPRRKKRGINPEGIKSAIHKKSPLPLLWGKTWLDYEDAAAQKGATMTNNPEKPALSSRKKPSSRQRTTMPKPHIVPFKAISTIQKSP